MKKLCVVFGGPSCEHDISIITGMQLAKSVSDKYQIEKIYYGLDGCFYLATGVDDLSFFSKKSRISLKKVCFFEGKVEILSKFHKKTFEVECVINCCHGGFGENGGLASLFEMNGIKYTSSCPLSAGITMDKYLTKLIVKDIVDVVPGVLIRRGVKLVDTGAINDLNDELIVKPNSLGSSIGVKFATKGNYTDQVQAIYEIGDDALVENYIANMVEYNQACFRDDDGLVVSAIEKPNSKSKILSFDDKYMSKSKTKGGDRELPAKISAKLQKQISDTTKAIYEKLNISGVARIDYIYDTKNKVLYFNEINTVPGSMSFYLYEPIGIDYISLVERLIANANVPRKYKYFETNVLDGKII